MLTADLDEGMLPRQPPKRRAAMTIGGPVISLWLKPRVRTLPGWDQITSALRCAAPGRQSTPNSAPDYGEEPDPFMFSVVRQNALRTCGLNWWPMNLFAKYCVIPMG
jgi:hypothetical protein